ncbi:MAG TPA: flagellar hook capping FlgD N-terminal domain-containing protein [Caulobacteraceae bacterium]|nr:flagellar hook capping FlgD N-terminal domain-containing protein [Caulobacteraceae bacterium]
MTTYTGVAPMTTVYPTPTPSSNSGTGTVSGASTSSAAAGNLSATAGLASLASNFQSFLSLLTTQLQNQDPLNPTDTDQFTEQITQMTGVQEQLLSNTLLQQLVTQQTGVSAGADLLGQVITAPGATSTAPDITGVVTSVETVGGQTMLTVGDNQVALSSVTGISENPNNSLAALLGE